MGRRQGSLIFLGVLAVSGLSAQDRPPADELSTVLQILEKSPGDPKAMDRLNRLGQKLSAPNDIDPRELRRLIRQANHGIKTQAANRKRALKDLSAAAWDGWRTSPAALLRACRGADLELQVALSTPPAAVRDYLRGYCPSLGQKGGPPAETDVHRVAGFISYARSDMDQALAEWDKALALSPNDIRLRKLTQTIQTERDRNKDRTTLYHTLNQADRARAMGNDPEAIGLYKKVLALEPSHPVALEEIRRLETQRETVNRQAALGAAIKKARHEEKAGHTDKAHLLWIKVLEVDPLNTEARERLGQLAPQPSPMAPPHPTNVAAASLEQAAEFYSLGLVRYAAGDLSGARKAFEHCLTLDPNHSRAKRALVRVKEEGRTRP